MAIVLWLIISIVIGVVADGKHRSGLGWFFLSLLISPLITAILLMVVGEKK